MNAAGRLAAFGAGLTVAFAAGYGVAAVVVPGTAVTTEQQAATDADHTAIPGPAPMPASATPAGLSLAENGFELTPVQAPSVPGRQGILRLTILDPSGEPLTDYATVHDKQLHLIVVRSDGQHFAHVHPRLDVGTGAWSTPWTWSDAGTYRVFTDFQPVGAESAKLTLSRTFEVAGTFAPVQAAGPRTVADVGGYTVHLNGDVAAGASRQLTAHITRQGAPVTTLQPYLSAFGHLVALRDGDLAYLHVHPEGAEPSPNQNGLPAVAFAAEAPTAGRYLLYFDFQVDETVHTATFVLDAPPGEPAGPAATSPPAGGHGGH
ncbi:hypothetical protein [Mycolicibacterium chlorophenolicum]|uniref:Heavy metal-binding domain-containing protein n=1 Tax=Mycolicibacterium chlorophenolicum TaxID=37916 RepID=A0A0J6VVJ8_9MYCO|nr:hypothetical protein [Mycolicibacterium chlorophenolicum]KMO73498.1 hypothetical protein MCHLDSM_03844 [Mycolicibacterium chlorophenolicum]